MTKLEELQKAAVLARRNWQWDELRAIDRAIAIENGSLAETVEALPPAPTEGESVLPWTGSLQVETVEEPTLEEPIVEEPTEQTASESKPQPQRGRSRSR